MKNKINIVLATDANYAQHAAVAMTSILLNTKSAAEVQFYILDDGLLDADKEKLQATATKHTSHVTFIKVQDPRLAKVFVSGTLTKAAYYRLDIAEILPAEVEKAIYLDCDLLVLQDIQLLWDIDLQGKPVGAVEDYGILASQGKRQEKAHSFGWQEENSYFNSGVLVIDLNKWRAADYGGQLLEKVNTKKYRHHDQDALNDILQGNWCRLPLAWNVIPPVFNMPLRVAMNKNLREQAVKALQAPAIIHYAGGYKPWEYAKTTGFNEYYYACLAQSAYKDAKMPQPNPKKTGHSLSRQLWRLKWSRAVQKFSV